MSWSDLVEMGWTGKEMKHFELDGEMQVYVYVSIDREKKKNRQKKCNLHYLKDVPIWIRVYEMMKNWI